MHDRSKGVPPLWREALGDMMRTDHGMFADTAICTEGMTGAASVDRMAASRFDDDRSSAGDPNVSEVHERDPQGFAPDRVRSSFFEGLR
jgi:hypothetical protein